MTRDTKSLLNLTSTLPRSRITVVDYAGSVGVRFRGPLRTRKRWLARILYGLTFPDYEPVVRGANWVFSELPQPMSRFHSAQLARLGFCAAGNARLGCRRADLSHLRTSAPVAPSGNKLASPIEDSARDERDRASARAGRQTVDVATSRLTRARRGVRESARARVQTRGAWCERSLVDFRWTVKSNLHRRATADGRERTDTSWVHRPASRSSIGAPK